MAHREFTAPDGTRWTVWDVVHQRGLTSGDPQLLPEAMRAGWLVFECALEKRRLVPPPADWAGAPDDELWALCLLAEPVSARER